MFGGMEGRQTCLSRKPRLAALALCIWEACRRVFEAEEGRRAKSASVMSGIRTGLHISKLGSAAITLAK